MKEAIDSALQVLKSGGVILYPTDTVWGLGCDATNPEAVAKIFAIKQRADAKSLVCLVSSDGMLQRFVKEVPELAWQLVDIADKPLTIVYPNALGLAKNAIAEDGSVAIRVVKHDFCQQLVHKFNKAIVSTSANISGQDAPTSLKKILTEITSKVDYIVPAEFDKGSTGQASSIIKLALSGAIEIIRK